jgi:hypothetical protein
VVNAAGCRGITATVRDPPLKLTYVDAFSSGASDVAPMMRLIEDLSIPAVGQKITTSRKRRVEDDAMAFSNGNR